MMEHISTHKTIWQLTGLTLAMAILIGLAGEWIPFLSEYAPVFAPARFGQKILVLDAGHGGEDGGAVSSSGVAESGLNLAIVLKTDQLAGLYGVPTLLLRPDEEALGDPNGATVRERKQSDLKKRVALINGVEHATLISVHQNYFSGSSSHGAQVFYGQEGSSPALASHAQALLCRTLDPENHRQAAPISNSVYLMSHISCPAILVECGFLSNDREAELLQQPEYQTKIAAALLSAYLTFDGTAEPS